jgi:hypothetical protein
MKDFKKMPKMACGGNVKKYADGGEAYVGTKLNLPVKTRLGKVSSSDARLLNKQDASPEGQKAKFERRHAIPSSATAEERSGATPGTEELQYIKRGGRIAKKVGKVKKYAEGKSVLADKLLNNTEDLDKKVNSVTSGPNYVIRSETLNKKIGKKTHVKQQNQARNKKKICKKKQKRAEHSFKRFFLLKRIMLSPLKKLRWFVV